MRVAGWDGVHVGRRGARQEALQALAIVERSVVICSLHRLIL